MGNFTSIFQHPKKGVYRYSFDASSLEEERNTAELMGAMSNEIFGDFLYARPVRQVLPACGKRYQFKINKSTGRLHYRDIHEKLFGQFDYFDIGGPHNSTVDFLVDVIKTGAFETQACGRFDAAMSIKFADFCNQYEFEFVRAAGGIDLLGIDEFHRKTVRISLEVGHTHMWL